MKQKSTAMRVSDLLPTLLTLLVCCWVHALQAQDESYYDQAYEKSYAERLQEFNGNLREARDYFQNQDDRAQVARTHKKIDQGLQGFLETEFMQKFRDMRLEVESLAASFKAYSQKLKPEQVVRVRKAYINIADNSNKLLGDIKRDFLDGNKLNHIRKYPEMYSGALELRLRELKDEYSNEFEKTIADITGSDQYSAAPIMAIFGIIQFAVDFTNYLVRVRYDNRKVKEEHLNMYFIEPFRFRSWEEIETISGDIYGHDPSEPAPDQPGQNDYQPADQSEIQPDSSGVINPFEENVESLKPKRKKNN